MVKLTTSDFQCAVALVNLTKNYKRWLNAEPALRDFELYEATRGYWPKSAAYMRNLGVDKVFAVHGGVIQEVYNVQDWYDAGTTMRHPIYVDDIVPARCEFVGNVVKDKEFVNKYKGNMVDFFDQTKKNTVQIIKDGVLVTGKNVKDLMSATHIKFKEMMESLVRESLGERVAECMEKMQANCQDIQEALPRGIELCVRTENGYEPCPFCFSGGDKLAELAFVGLNPGKPLSEWIGLDEKTTWYELAEFCAPANGILASKYNAYRCLARDGVKNSYYQNVFLTSMALLESTENILENITSAREKIGNDEKITQKFLSHFDSHPILNSEMIPYKSVEMNFNANKLKGKEWYRDYVRKMMEFILCKTTDDAYILFQGGTVGVKEVLEKIDEFGLGDNVWKEEEFSAFTKDGKEGKKCKIYFAHWKGNRTVIIAPVRRKKRGGGYAYRLSDLVNKLKLFRTQKNKR